MGLPLVDLLVFILYLTAILFFGISFYFKKNRTTNDYMTGGQRIPSWAIGMSIFATFVSSISFLALPGKAYLSNWNSFVFSLSIPLAAFFAVKFFVPLYRKINSQSAYYHLEERFGSWARNYASICYLLTQLARMGTILYLLALPTNALLGWDINTIIIGTGLFVIVYAAMGGIEAVIWTDAIQGIVLISGAIACLLLIVASMPEGTDQIIEIGRDNNKFDLGSFNFKFTESTFWVVLFYGFFINLQNFGIDQNYVQRYMSAKTEKAAKRSTWFGSLLYIPVSLLFFMIGTALFAYYKTFPELLPSTLGNIIEADKIFPYFIVAELPKGVTGLLIASIFAAGMSTISTSINSSSTVILTDFFKRNNKEFSSKNEFRILAISGIIMGVLSILVSLAMTSVKSALDTWWALSSIFSGGVLGLFLLGFLSRKIKKIEATIAVIIGILVIAWMSLTPVFVTSEKWILFKNPLHTNLTIVVGTIVIFLSGFLLNILLHNKNNGLI
ncbi:solute:Na+ symporter, SSS family [Zunongwangia mangrovi]|uniref:Solute:Na+ symporter, SSS family n=1 Tax=Zunongwangia mangrovi TaxID=1334022 RepID=A0A1I1JBP0_9FLAO|nr:sodium:solute symporter [Zunongwangia mangrovi]SFC45997.1 solute:Na+ symporter, SSS family [Zunongwangia mangrovi]